MPRNGRDSKYIQSSDKTKIITQIHNSENMQECNKNIDIVL